MNAVIYGTYNATTVLYGRWSERSSRSLNLLSGKVLLNEIKFRSSSFVRGAFVIQATPIRFEEYDGNMTDVSKCRNLIG